MDSMGASFLHRWCFSICCLQSFMLENIMTYHLGLCVGFSFPLPFPLLLLFVDTQMTGWLGVEEYLFIKLPWTLLCCLLESKEKTYLFILFTSPTLAYVLMQILSLSLILKDFTSLFLRAVHFSVVFFFFFFSLWCLQVLSQILRSYTFSSAISLNIVFIWLPQFFLRAHPF